MKIKLWFPCILVIVAALNSQAVQFSNSVHVTTNMVFFLTSIKSSVQPTNQFGYDELIYYRLVATSTNYVHYKALPFQQTFDFHLFDEKGREIQKTERGLTYSQAAVLPTSRREVVGFKVRAVGYECHGLFCPEQMFAITNKGVYDLKIRMRILVPASNGVLNIKAMMNGTNVAFAKELGMVISDPLRVKVIKE